MTESLAEALPRQIARVSAIRARWMEMAAAHPEMAVGMAVGIALMKAEIDVSLQAIADGDVAAMMAAYEALAAYEDE